MQLLYEVAFRVDFIGDESYGCVVDVVSIVVVEEQEEKPNDVLSSLHRLLQDLGCHQLLDLLLLVLCSHEASLVLNDFSQELLDLFLDKEVVEERDKFQY